MNNKLTCKNNVLLHSTVHMVITTWQITCNFNWTIRSILDKLLSQTIQQWECTVVTRLPVSCWCGCNRQAVHASSSVTYFYTNMPSQWSYDCTPTRTCFWNGGGGGL